MKKHILYTLLLIGLTVASCQKEEIVPVKSKTDKIDSNGSTNSNSKSSGFIVDPNDRNEAISYDASVKNP